MSDLVLTYQCKDGADGSHQFRSDSQGDGIPDVAIHIPGGGFHISQEPVVSMNINALCIIGSRN